jgi:hypothetical protein
LNKSGIPLLFSLSNIRACVDRDDSFTYFIALANLRLARGDRGMRHFDTIVDKPTVMESRAPPEFADEAPSTVKSREASAAPARMTTTRGGRAAQ